MIKNISILSVLIAAFVSVVIVTDAKGAQPTPTEVVPGKILVSTLKLQDYLTNLEPDTIVEKRDSQGGDKPDIFIVFKKNPDGTKSLVMQLLDLNHDGKIDDVKHFKDNKLVREEKDTHSSGTTDLIIEYNPQTGDIKKKSQANKNTNIWTYFLKKNVPYRKEIDRNGDGRPDMWIYFKNGKAYRTEIDQNYDGKKIVRLDKPSDYGQD